MNSTVRVTGEVLRVAYHDPRSWQARLVIAMEDDQPVVVDGRVPIRPYPGMIATVAGEGSLDQGYRRIKAADEVDLRPPDGGRPRLRYVRALMRGMPDELVKKIANYPGDPAGALVPDVPFRTAVSFREKWRDALVPLTWSRALVQAGIGRDRASRIARVAYDSEESPPELLETEPYRLFALGASWSESERIAERIGIFPSDLRRVRAGITQVLRRAESRGSTAIHRPALVAEATRLLGIDHDDVDQIVEREIAFDNLVVGRADLLQRPEVAAAEDAVARNVARLLALPARGFEEPQDWGSLNTRQREAVRNAFTQRASILTGGPGCGKTFTPKQILDWWDGDVLITGPTGTAAFRAEKAMGRRAGTMHSALRGMRTAGGWRFEHGEGRPFRGRKLLVIGDEFTMADAEISAAFFGAVPPDGHVMLIGDLDQLPSVGAGAVLRDLISAGVPTVELERGYRMGGVIADFAHAVKRRERTALRDHVDGDTLRHINVGHADATVAQVQRLLHAGAELADVAVLSPVYGGPNGVHQLNATLKRLLNPQACEAQSGRLPGVPIVRHWEKPRGSSEEIDVPVEAQFMAPGDRVITREPDLYSRNGEAGVVVACGLARDREPWMEVLSDDGIFRRYEGTEVQRLDLAYARTVHRAQGDQHRHVIVAISGQEGHLLDHSVLYTGWTRAQETLTTVGPSDLIESIIAGEFDSLRQRETTLSYRMRDALRLRAPHLAKMGALTWS